MTRPKKSDWVRCHEGSATLGSVIRVAKDGTWADVRWRARGLGEWSKRMLTRHLTVEHTIPFAGSMTVTDMTRKKEMEADGD